MKKILVINGHQTYENIAEGGLTSEYINTANNYLEKNGYEVKISHPDKGYDVQEELAKWDWADFILLQYPVYWMGLPGITKSYIDEVSMAGMGTITFENDGRSTSDPFKKYGSGGLMTNKKYMLSISYSCPISEFDNKDGFFEGLSVDEANYCVHKIFQFCGVEKTDTYSVHDIYKSDLNLEEELKKFTKTLENNLKG